MSNAIFPTLSAIAWPVKRSEIWKTRTYESISGKENRIADWTYPRHQFDLGFEALNSGALARGGLLAQELQSLMGFFDLRQASFDSFLYPADDDSAVIGQPLGVGDGTTASFQLLKTFGGFVEPVLAPRYLTAAYIAGVPQPGTGLSAPANGGLGFIPGGSLAGATYFVRSTLVTPAGETPAAPEGSRVVAANNLLTVASPAAGQGAIGWNVYVSTATGTETRQNGTTPIPIGTGWTEPSTGLVAGVALPSTSNSFSLSTWGAAAPGVLTFATPPGASSVISADLSYYYPCRFMEDQLDFEKFMFQLWMVKSVKFISLKSA